MSKYPNGFPPNAVTDPDLAAASPGTHRIESVRVTYGLHRRGRQVDLVVGSRLPVATKSGTVLGEIVQVDVGRAKPYGAEPVGGTGLAWFDATGFAEHWEGTP